MRKRRIEDLPAAQDINVKNETDVVIEEYNQYKKTTVGDILASVAKNNPALYMKYVTDKMMKVYS